MRPGIAGDDGDFAPCDPGARTWARETGTLGQIEQRAALEKSRPRPGNGGQDDSGAGTDPVAEPNSAPDGGPAAGGDQASALRRRRSVLGETSKKSR